MRGLEQRIFARVFARNGRGTRISLLDYLNIIPNKFRMARCASGKVGTSGEWSVTSPRGLCESESQKNVEFRHECPALAGHCTIGGF